MPPRSGQLDQISEAIGGLRASVDGIERYMHEREHGMNNLAQKVDGLSQQITREVSRMKAEIQVQLETISARVTKLEDAAAQQRGAKNLVVWVLQSPLVGWIAAGVIGFAALLRHK
jgi:phosphoglycerate-specific signal transduction histidine kinase